MRRLVLAALLVGSLAACGGGGDGRFDDDVAAVRDAVDAGDPTGAAQALDTLAVDALAAHQDGVIDDAELQEVADLVEASRAEVAELFPTTTTTTTTTATSTTTAPPPVAHDGDDHGGGEREGGHGKPGKGKGRGD